MDNRKKKKKRKKVSQALSLPSFLPLYKAIEKKKKKKKMNFVTVPIILCIELGGKPKWLPLNFGYHDVMHTVSIICAPKCILRWPKEKRKKKEKNQHDGYA